MTRLLFRRSFRDVSFRFGGRRTLFAILLALGIPLSIGLLSYGGSWIIGLTQFVVPYGTLPTVFPQPSNPIAYILETFLITVTIGTLLFSLFTLGEEIGWRGFMLTRLVEARVPLPLFSSGLIWGLWHFPDILSGNYKPILAGAPLPLAITLFLMSIVTFGYFVAWLRLRTGSIWPCVVAHSAWNAVTQILLDPSTKGKMSGIWVGEAGILTVIVSIVIIVLLIRIFPLRQMLARPDHLLIAEANPVQGENKIEVEQIK